MRLEDTLNKILIVDFGSQFTQLIARKIRELGIYCEIVSNKKIEKKGFKAKISLDQGIAELIQILSLIHI